MKKQLFKTFVTHKYYENRDEYDSSGQRQPYSDLKQYVTANLSLLKSLFKARSKEKL